MLGLFLTTTVTRKRSAALKKMTNNEHLALSQTKKQTQVASGLY